MITVQGVTVIFGRTVALDSIDATIEPGITGLFGPNASGKSTLLRVIAGLLEPTRGVTLIEGRPSHRADESLRRRIGYVGHDSGLYARLSVAENVDLFARLHGADPARGRALMESLGIDDRADTLVRELSAGYRRRAAVARALVHDPDVLLVDEPYANLDDDAAALVSQTIQAWHRDGRAAFIATHGAKRVKSFADAGLILKRGRIAVFGRYDRAALSRRSS